MNRSKMGKQSRIKGHCFERNIAKDFRELGWPEATTSRAGDRSEDNKGRDILNTYPFRLQCKCHNVFKNPIPVLEDMEVDTDYNIVLMKVKNKGEFAIMDKQDFYELIKILKKEKII